jgi:mRNA-degrading endonuclease RelE of RelBE toxin-antitoxin system
MAFNIVVDPSALKELKKIKKGVPHLFFRLVKSIDSLSQDPLDDKVVHIIAAGHRREIYR